MTNLNWFEFNIDTFLLVFIVLNIVNVIIQTIKSIVTITGTPMLAATINAITFAIYTVVVVFMNADGLGIIWKAVIIGVVNFIGVYAVKWWETKVRKSRLWKVEATINGREVSAVKEKLQALKISYNCFRTSGEYWVFNIFCPTQNESAQVKWILNKHRAKYFVSESKTL